MASALVKRALVWALLMLLAASILRGQQRIVPRSWVTLEPVGKLYFGAYVVQGERRAIMVTIWPPDGEKPRCAVAWSPLGQAPRLEDGKACRLQDIRWLRNPKSKKINGLMYGPYLLFPDTLTTITP